MKIGAGVFLYLVSNTKLVPNPQRLKQALSGESRNRVKLTVAVKMKTEVKERNVSHLW